MSAQSFVFNPRERTLAATGDGFSFPAMSTTQRITLVMLAGDAGMEVYDTTLRQVFLWDGSAWIPQSGGTSSITTYDTVALLRAADLSGLSTGDLVETSGYWAVGDRGANLYWVDRTDVVSADNGGSVLVTSAGIRVKCTFTNLISVCQWGAKVDGVTNDDAYVQQALTYQQSSTAGTRILFFPCGVCLISTTLTGASRPLYVLGEGSSANSNSTVSVIRMATSNTPIISWQKDCERITNVRLEYQTYQVAANTLAVGLLLVAGSYKSVAQNVSISRAAYGVYSASGDDSWQHEFRDMYINGFSISGFYLDGNATEISIDNLYLQNLIVPPGSTSTGVITSASRVGAVITFTLASVPTNLKVNRYCQIFGIDATYNKIVVITAVVGNDVTFSLTADPGYDPVITPSSYIQFAAQKCTGPAFYLGTGIEASLTAIDIEHIVTQSSSVASVSSPSANFSKLYFEQVYSDFATHHIIRHDYGSLVIDNLVILNSGCSPGQPGVLIRDQSSAINGAVQVIGMAMRDMAYSGTTFAFASKLTPAAPDITLDRFSQLVTNRANAVSVFSSYGDAVINRGRKWDLQTLTASSGTQVSISDSVTVAQSGTASFVAYSLDVTRTTTGSGTQVASRVVIDGTTVWSIAGSGAITATVPSFDIVGGSLVVTATNARIDAVSTNANSSTFGGASNVTSAVRLDYGSAVDRLLSLTGNGVQSYVRSTAATANLSIQAIGGNCSIGTGAAGAGLIVGFGKGSTISVIKLATGTMVAGTVTIADTDTRADTVIIPTRKTLGGTAGFTTYTLNVGVGYTINSTSVLDTSIFDIVAIHK